MKRPAAALFFGLMFLATMVSSLAQAKETRVYKRGWAHYCLFLVARLGTGDVPHNPFDLAGRYDDEVNDFLRNQWEPDSNSRLSVVAQMKQVGKDYEALLAEGFSTQVSRLAASKGVTDELFELRDLKFSDDQMIAALHATSDFENLANVVRETSWSVESVIAVFRVRRQALQRNQEIHRELRESIISITNNKSTALYNELNQVIALEINLNPARVIALAKAGLSAEKTIEICKFLAKKYPSDGGAAAGYLTFYTHGFSHEEAMILSSLDNTDLIEAMAFKELEFSASDIKKILENPFARRLGKRIYFKALAIGHDKAEAHKIATHHAVEFANWVLMQDLTASALKPEFRFTIPDAPISKLQKARLRLIKRRRGFWATKPSSPDSK